MNKFKLVLNDKGIQELLKSDEMQSILSEHGATVARRAGAGYESDVHEYKKRAVANVYPATSEAAVDNLENNTLLKALG